MKITSQILQVSALFFLLVAIGIGVWPTVSIDTGHQIAVTTKPEDLPRPVVQEPPRPVVQEPPRPVVQEPSQEFLLKTMQEQLESLDEKLSSVEHSVSSGIQDQLLFGFAGIVSQILSGMFGRRRP